MWQRLIGGVCSKSTDGRQTFLCSSTHCCLFEMPPSRPRLIPFIRQLQLQCSLRSASTTQQRRHRLFPSPLRSVLHTTARDREVLCINFFALSRKTAFIRDVHYSRRMVAIDCFETGSLKTAFSLIFHQISRNQSAYHLIDSIICIFIYVSVNCSSDCLFRCWHCSSLPRSYSMPWPPCSATRRPSWPASCWCSVSASACRCSWPCPH